MKILFDETMEIITPCFCAGADQTKAEIRAPSIRGELRWWFRALGGTREQEARVFGSIEAKDKNKKLLTENQSSAVVVRISNQQKGSDIKLPSMKMGTPLSYLLFFANASGKARGTQYGPRFQKDGMLPPDTTFRMQILLKSNISTDDSELLIQAIDTLRRVGTIGYRGRRACGAWATDHLEGFDDFKQWAKSNPDIKVVWPVQNGKSIFQPTWFSAMQESEFQLKEMRRSGFSSKESTPLGTDKPRQASAVRFRPVRLKEGFLPVVVFSDYALANCAVDSGFILEGKVIGDSILSSQ